MPGENFSRRVARAAAVGGGRTYHRQTPFGWYVLLLAICVGGVGLIAYSRYERLHPTAAASNTSNVPPTKADLWKVGLALDICGKSSYLPATAGVQALSTNGHGVVTIEPGLATDPTLYSGAKATLQAFLLPQNVILGSARLQLPGKSPTTATPTTSSTTTTSTTSTSTTSTTAASSSTTSTTKPGSSTTTTSTTVPAPKPIIYTNGQTCHGKKAIVQVMEWASPSAKHGHLVAKASTLRFKNGQLITIAFVPKGATIPKPGSASKIAAYLLSNPAALAPPSIASSTTLPVTVPTTTPATTSTTAGSSTTTTTSKG